MSKPIAILGDLHVCPIHRGGPIISPGQSHVRLNGIPVAVQGGRCLCGSSGSDALAIGASGVRINGKSVMRLGDRTAHGGTVTTGQSRIKIS